MLGGGYKFTVKTMLVLHNHLLILDQQLELESVRDAWRYSTLIFVLHILKLSVAQRGKITCLRHIPS